MKTSPKRPLSGEALRELDRLDRAGFHTAQIAFRLDCVESAVIEARKLIERYGLEGVCAIRARMTCRATVFREIAEKPSPRYHPPSHGGEYNRWIRPLHTIGEVASPEWFKSCDDAFQSAMVKALLEAKAEREASAA
jgi:hypothetical protein